MIISNQCYYSVIQEVMLFVWIQPYALQGGFLSKIITCYFWPRLDYKLLFGTDYNLLLQNHFA